MALFVSLREEPIVFLIRQNVFLPISLPELPHYRDLPGVDLCGTGTDTLASLGSVSLQGRSPSGDEAAVGEVPRPTLVTASLW